MLFKIIGTNYFDDFPTFEAEALAPSATKTFDGLCELLGWTLASEEKKNLGFAQIFCPLGVQINLSSLPEGFLVIENRAARLVELADMSQRFLDADRMKPSEAAPLRGKLLYSEQQALGRCGAMATRALGRRATGDGGAVALSDDLRSALAWILKFTKDTIPRIVRLRDPRRPVVVFTDGASHPDGTSSCGGLIFDGSERPEMFGFEVPAAIAAGWASSTASKQVIGQAELFPVWVAKAHWAEKLKGRRVIFFVDNDSARFALIRMFSPVRASADILWQIAELDLDSRATPWYARVASASNPADGPSRLDFEEARREWAAVRVYPVIPEIPARSGAWG